MEFRNTLSALYANSQEISRLIEHLRETNEMHTIDIDILLGKLRDMYDIVNDIRTEKMSPPSIKPEENNEEPKEDPAEAVSIESSVEEEIVEIETDDISETAISESESAGLEETIEEQAVFEPILIPDDDSLVSDRFQSEEKILNEEISPSPEKSDLSSQLTGTPITSIVGAIGINDKFEFVNELFDAKLNDFDTCMEKLDSMESVDEAFSFLEETYKWDMGNSYVQRILNLVQRKLMA